MPCLSSGPAETQCRRSTWSTARRKVQKLGCTAQDTLKAERGVRRGLVSKDVQKFRDPLIHCIRLLLAQTVAAECEPSFTTRDSISALTADSKIDLYGLAARLLPQVDVVLRVQEHQDLL